MKFKVFSVYDQKAQAYLPPFFMHNTALATRAFRDAVNQPDHAFQRNPEDYLLFVVAEFDDSSGVFEVPAAPVLVVNGLQCVRLQDSEVKTDAHA